MPSPFPAPTAASTCPLQRPLLPLAGGTGIAPFLSMLEVLAAKGFTQPVHLVYAVTNDRDLVGLAQLDRIAAHPAFTYVTAVAAEASKHRARVMRPPTSSRTG